jgi:putative transposase
MKLARSTYYYRGRRTAPEQMALRERIEALCAECPRDGYRRITHQLRAEGTAVNHKAVARLMRQNGLQVRPLAQVRAHDGQQPRRSDLPQPCPRLPPNWAQSTVGGRYQCAMTTKEEEMI